MREDFGREIARTSESSARRIMPGLLSSNHIVISDLIEGPPEYPDQDSSVYAPAIGGVRNVGADVITEGSLQLAPYSSQDSFYEAGVDFEELPSSGSFRNLTIPENQRLIANFYYREVGGDAPVHSSLPGLSGDDHIQYALSDGTRLSVAGINSFSGTIPDGTVAHRDGELVRRLSGGWISMLARPTLHVHPAATDSSSGYMTADDRIFLDALKGRESGGDGGSGGSAVASSSFASKLKHGG